MGMFNLLRDNDTSEEQDTAGAVEVAEPYSGKPCPFYGFVGCSDFYMGEPLGNGCALTGEHSPCRLEMAGEETEWDRCWRYNVPENQTRLAEIMEKVSVAPKSFWPKGVSSWKGMKFGLWFRHVMGHDFP